MFQQDYSSYMSHGSGQFVQQNTGAYGQHNQGGGGGGNFMGGGGGGHQQKPKVAPKDKPIKGTLFMVLSRLTRF